MTRESFILSTPAHDPYFQNAAWQQWFRYHCPILAGYTPSFDLVPKWHPGALCYFDAYAIFDVAFVPSPQGASGGFSFYSDIDAALILKDANGNPLKINWQQADGTYHQYAGDITNPAFLAKAIGLMRGILAKGYAGLYIDDVNLSPTFVTEAGQPAAFDIELWRPHLISYVQTIRKAFPSIPIVHNPVWWETDPAQIQAADYINIERGFGDSNFKPSDFIKLSQAIEGIHKQGRKVIVEEYLKSNLPVSLPCYDAICQPGDLIAVEDMLPDSWLV